MPTARFRRRRLWVASSGTLVGVLCLAATAGAATFPGAGFGAIPQPVGSGPGDYSGAPLNVTFTAAGLTGVINDVQVNVTLDHTWVSDLRVTLISPGDVATHTIFSQTGNATSTGFGDGSDTAGPYNFSDAAPATPTWWTAADAVGNATAIPAGSYRATTPGPGGGVVTTITPTFAALTQAEMNGTWTLRVHDGAAADFGSVTAASLVITAVPDVTPPAPPALSGTDPASPADNNSPKIQGTAEAGSTVRLYTSSDCSGTPAATGAAAELTAPGLAVSVADNSTTDFRATATDAAANVSTCSAPITFAEVTPDTTPPTLTVEAKKSQKFGKPIKLTVSADEPCAIVVKGKLAHGLGKAKQTTAELPLGVPTTLKAKLGKKALAAGEAALDDGDVVKAKLTAVCTDAAGNASTGGKAKVGLK